MTDPRHWTTFCASPLKSFDGFFFQRLPRGVRCHTVVDHNFLFEDEEMGMLLYYLFIDCILISLSN